MKDRESIQARRYFILESVGQKGTLSFGEIRKLFNPQISDPTLRKDINAIVRLPVVLKSSRGGLIASSKGLFKNTYFSVNLEVDASNKQRIARRLVEGDPPFECFPLINRNGDSCVVGPGTTTLAVLCVMGKYPGIEVLTTNLGSLGYPDLLTKPSFHLSGGWCLKSVASLVGSTAVKNINAFVANSAIIGISGLAVSDDGNEVRLYCHHEAQLTVKQALVQGRKNVIVVTCGNKLNKRDAWEFATTSQLLRESNLYIVTDCVSDDIGVKIRDCFNELCSRTGNCHVAKLIELEKDDSPK